ncbi:hypothetical protein H312_02989 [Anncaliia algerae PRA339]|uniref:Dynamin-type G domain-containing protein n=1 Tax=Anncaliia algerae PRA339 TaxID=1288291 RepID=A0A059EY40_9MICR|nr:hypothetical protein H312_02989 [Anncaliia algerae PRA339]
MAINIDLLIEKINSLQDICNSTCLDNTLDLPQIVVIGSQSSGKTSVLENIVGRDFLPRGTGIVTRRPLILQLIYRKDATEEYCEFNHLPTKIFTNFEEVKKEILEETSRILKSKNDVCDIPITLKLYSSKVLTLTLVDLPGLIKVPAQDQPKNIVLRIEEMCRKFVTNKNAIILAVSSANIDISNSDSLHLARSVDPNYNRTIGVLTKLDLMDKGTDVVDVLAGRIIKLKLGFVPLINRSQTEIIQNKSIEAALKDEKIYFENHPAYKKNKLYCGTPYLVQKLHSILHEHIKFCLPNLQSSIDKMLIDYRNELEIIGTISFTPKEYMFKIINDISKKFKDTLEGRCELSSTELVGGARLNYTFHHHFAEFITQLDALGNVKDEQIRTLLYNSGGSSSTLLFAHIAFEKLSKQSIALFKPHCLKLVGIIFNELIKIVHQITQNLALDKFPVFNDKIIQSLVNLFKSKTETTHYLVSSFIDWNIAYINTKHPDFHQWRYSIKENESKEEVSKNEKSNKITFDPIPANLKITKNMSEQDLAEVQTIKSLVNNYFNIIKKIVVDQIPKAIMNELVIKSEQEVQTTLFREVYEAEGVAETINESDEIKERRVFLENMIKALKQAYDIICSI